MVRRRKIEGLTIDLTRIPENGVFVLDDLIVHEEVGNKKEACANRCTQCGIEYNCTKQINGGAVCYMCYKLDGASPEMIDYIHSIYSKPCEFCGVVKGLKHFDHKNIFLKRYTILDMTYMTVDEVKDEVSRCQLLCIMCHKIVTSMEHRLGYITKKLRVNKLRKEMDVSDMIQLYKEEYDRDMEMIYDVLKSSGIYL